MENRPPEAAEPTPLALGDDEEEEAEMEKLEEEVKEMAQKLSSYRSTFPDQLRSSFAAVLAAQRPQFPVLDRDSDPGSASGIDHDADTYHPVSCRANADSHGESSKGVVSAAEDQETAERIKLLKEKISSNISAMPLVLKRMNECISRIDKLNSRSDIIHPAFKRKKS